jgi:hypothetical protein
MQLVTDALRRISLVQLSALPLFVLALLLATGVHAQETDWIGGNTGKWENPANWNAGVPVAGLQTRVGNALTDPNAHSTATIDDNTGTASTGNLFVSDNQANFGTLIMNAGATNGGTLINSTGFFAVGGNNLTNGGNGTFILNAGTVLMSTGSFNSGWASSTTARAITIGNVFVNGGLFSMTGSGQSFGVALRGTGTLTQTNGTLSLGSAAMTIGRSGGFGTMVMSGGTVTMGTGSNFTGANSSTSIGYLDLSGTGYISSESVVLASAGNATFNVGGGTLNNSGSLQGSTGGNGTLLLRGGAATGTSFTIANGTSAVGYFDIGSGTLSTAGNIEVTRGAGTGTLRMTNGRVTANNLLFAINSTVIAGTVDIRGGQMLINTNINFSNNTSTGNGKGTFTLNQDSVSIPTELVVAGRITQSGGTANVAFNGGTLTVQTIGFNTGVSDPFNAGTLSPGNANVLGGGAQIGSTTFATLNPVGTNFANFNQKKDYHLHIDVSDGGLHDLVALQNGTATLGGIIDVDYIGVDSHPGQFWDIMTAGTANGIHLVAEDLANNIPGTRLIAHNDGYVYQLSLVTTTLANDTLRLTLVVPEPATFGLVGLGAFTLLGRRSRRRQRSTRSKPSITPLAC